jgi:hypothetical protein
MMYGVGLEVRMQEAEAGRRFNEAKEGSRTDHEH